MSPKLSLVFAEAGMKSGWYHISLSCQKPSEIFIRLSTVWMSIACNPPIWARSKCSKNGLQETDGMIQTIMGYGLRAGLLSCMGSLALMIVLIMMPNKLHYAGVYIVWRECMPTPY